MSRSIYALQEGWGRIEMFDRTVSRVGRGGGGSQVRDGVIHRL